MKLCAICESEFEPMHPNHIHCSGKCAAKSYTHLVRPNTQQDTVFDRKLDFAEYELLHDPDGTLKKGSRFTATDHLNNLKYNVYLAGTVILQRDTGIVITILS